MTRRIALALLAVTLSGCGGTAPEELVRRAYPACERFIGPGNPEVRNGIIGFDCGQEVDGPYYFLRESDGTLISLCGGVCMAPSGAQVDVCRTLCPPPGW